mmetsp:Transcript_4831/g.10372  ORF Transcript_4831/g.10372 Transcript_4831/m.10372 type:complete len:244 (-) Transcript_4831:184-915(-)
MTRRSGSGGLDGSVRRGWKRRLMRSLGSHFRVLRSICRRSRRLREGWANDSMSCLSLERGPGQVFRGRGRWASSVEVRKCRPESVGCRGIRSWWGWRWFERRKPLFCGHFRAETLFLGTACRHSGPLLRPLYKVLVTLDIPCKLRQRDAVGLGHHHRGARTRRSAWCRYHGRRRWRRQRETRRVGPSRGGSGRVSIHPILGPLAELLHGLDVDGWLLNAARSDWGLVLEGILIRAPGIRRSAR